MTLLAMSQLLAEGKTIPEYDTVRGAYELSMKALDSWAEHYRWSGAELAELGSGFNDVYEASGFLELVQSGVYEALSFGAYNASARQAAEYLSEVSEVARSITGIAGAGQLADWLSEQSAQALQYAEAAQSGTVAGSTIDLGRAGVEATENVIDTAAKPLTWVEENPGKSTLALLGLAGLLVALKLR